MRTSHEVSYSQALVEIELTFVRTGSRMHPVRRHALKVKKLPNLLLDDGLTDGLRMKCCYDAADFDPEPIALQREMAYVFVAEKVGKADHAIDRERLAVVLAVV